MTGAPQQLSALGGDTGRRVGIALLAYMLGVTLIVTLLPFRFERPDELRIIFFGHPSDVIANVLLFVPLGFLYTVARAGAHRRPVLAALGLGALLSLGIESAQLFAPTRNSSALDVLTNAGGAALGAAAFGRIARSASNAGRAIGWLALELPLMGLVYLLVPLLWVSSLAAHGSTLRGAATFLVGVFGAILLGGMQRAYFGPNTGAKAAHTAAFCGAWFLAGAFPSLAWQPLGLLAGAAALTVLCFGLGRRRVAKGAHNRRFEVRLLAMAAPVYLAYLALASLASLGAGLTEWTLRGGFGPGASDQIEILRLLELIAAFTLVGYMSAEARGRSVPRYTDATVVVAAAGFALALANELAHGFAAGQGASVTRGVILVLAALYGAWLYYLQRAHVMRLLAGGAGHEAAAAPLASGAGFARTPARRS